MESLSASAADQLKEAANGATARFAEIFVQGQDEGSLSFQGSAEHAAMSFFAMLQGLQTLCRAKGETRTFRKAAATYIDSISNT